MKITIRPTESITRVDGRPCRVWDGVTDDGARCLVLVALVAVPEGEDTAPFDRRLCGRPAPFPAPDDLPQLARDWEVPT